MNRRILAVAVILPLAASIVALAPFGRDDGPAPAPAYRPSSIFPPARGLDEIPEFPELPEPDTGPPARYSPQFEDSALSETLFEINLALRASLDGRIRSDRRSALNAGFGNEEKFVLPALPGVYGFELAICPRSRNCLNAQLLEQTDDPSWARPMEAGIYDELSRVSGGVGQAHVVCRQTICGVLLPSSPGAVQPDLQQMAEQLRIGLGFSPYYNSADQDDLQALYLTTELPSWWPVTEGDD